jgi:sugar diacid utilization regulator
MAAETGDPTLARLRRGTGALTAAALQRMDDRLAWYRAMGADERSWVGLVAQAGIASFIAWYEAPGGDLEVTADVFGTAPRELTRSVSLQQTLEMVRIVVDAVEDHVGELAGPGDEPGLRESVLRYSREVAFAAAQVYAQAAEARGAWDARLEALVVDAVVRGDADDGLRSHAAALGWDGDLPVAVVVGSTPHGAVEHTVDDLRRHARAVGADALVGVQGDRLVVILGRTARPLDAAAALAVRFGPGPVVTGPVRTGLDEAGRSARAALAGLVAARAWPRAPRPVAADDLLPERLLSGDTGARRSLVDRAYRCLAEGHVGLLETVSTYLDLGRSLEATARALFVHPNTVRYRLHRVAGVTGWDPTDPREAFVLQVAIVAGRLAGPPSRRESGPPPLEDSSKGAGRGSSLAPAASPASEPGG